MNASLSSLIRRLPLLRESVKSSLDHSEKFIMFALRRSVIVDYLLMFPGVYYLILQLLPENSFAKFHISQPASHLRSHDYLFVSYHRTDYGFLEPVSNLSKVFNNFVAPLRVNLRR